MFFFFLRHSQFRHLLLLHFYSPSDRQQRLVELVEQLGRVGHFRGGRRGRRARLLERPRERRPRLAGVEPGHASLCPSSAPAFRSGERSGGLDEERDVLGSLRVESVAGEADIYDGGADSDVIQIGTAAVGTSVDLSGAGNNGTLGFINVEGITFVNTSGTSTATFNGAQFGTGKIAAASQTFMIGSTITSTRPVATSR